MPWKSMRPVRLCENEHEIQVMIARVLNKALEQRTGSAELCDEDYALLRSRCEKEVREHADMVLYYQASVDMD